MEKIRVIIKKVDESPSVEWIDNDPDDPSVLQKIVGGYIEIIPVNPAKNLIMIDNEDGKIDQLPMNFPLQGHFGYDFVCGDVLLSKQEGPDLVSLTDEDIEYILFYIFHTRK